MGGRRTPVLVAAIAIVTAALALFGCGDDQPGEDEARTTAAGFLDAYADYDPALCELSTSSRQAQIVLGAPESGGSGDTCEEVIGGLHDDLNSGDGPGELFGADEIRAAAANVDEAEYAVEGDNALITFPAEADGSPGAITSVALLVEDGEWRVEDFGAG